MTREERIDLIVKTSRFSQDEISRFCGVTSGAISQWRSGATKDIKMEPFLRLCQITGTNPWWLAMRVGSQHMSETEMSKWTK